MCINIVVLYNMQTVVHVWAQLHTTTLYYNIKLTDG